MLQTLCRRCECLTAVRHKPDFCHCQLGCHQCPDIPADQLALQKLVTCQMTSCQLPMCTTMPAAAPAARHRRQLRSCQVPCCSPLNFPISQVISIQYLHASSVIYCDLKPSNILLDENGRIKLGGFGLSRRLSDINKTPLQQLPSVGVMGFRCLGAEALCTGQLWSCLLAVLVSKWRCDRQDLPAAAAPRKLRLCSRLL